MNEPTTIENKGAGWSISAWLDGFKNLHVKAFNRTNTSIVIETQFNSPTKRELQDIGLMFIGLANSLNDNK